jgi:hypothetical protein
VPPEAAALTCVSKKGSAVLWMAKALSAPPVFFTVRKRSSALEAPCTVASVVWGIGVAGFALLPRRSLASPAHLLLS